MSERSVISDMPDVAATAQFLRRFADLMSNGQNATYLLRAAELLQTLTARAIAEIDEVTLWRHKYDAVTRLDAELKAEVEVLKQDIDGHVNVSTLLLNERDALQAMLMGREVELLEVNAIRDHEHSELTAKLVARESEIGEFRAGVDRQRNIFEATAKAQNEKCVELRSMVEREREEFTIALKNAELDIANLRFVLEKERADFQLRSRASAEELQAFRVASQRECEDLQAKLTVLELNREQLRAAFGRIRELRDQPIGRQDSFSRDVSDRPELSLDPDAKQRYAYVIGETDLIVPEATLRQMRAQFEYLARQCIPQEDIASRVMCELGAYTIGQILTSGARSSERSVSETVLNILDGSGSAARVLSQLV